MVLKWLKYIVSTTLVLSRESVTRQWQSMEDLANEFADFLWIRLAKSGIVWQKNQSTNHQE